MKIFKILTIFIFSFISMNCFAAAKPELDAAKSKLEKAFVAVGSLKCLVPNKIIMPKAIEPWVIAVNKDVKDFVDKNADSDGKDAFETLKKINRNFVDFLLEADTSLRAHTKDTFESQLNNLNDNHQKLEALLKKKRNEKTTLAKRGDVIELLIDLNQDLFALISRTYNDSQRYGLVNEQKNILIRSVVSHQNAAFGKGILITAPLTAKELNQWLGTIDDVGKYINTNAPELNTYVTQIKTINTVLINTLKVIFDTYISTVLLLEKDKQKGIDLIDPDTQKIFLDPKRINIAQLKLKIPEIKKAIVPLDQQLEKLRTVEKTLDETLKKYRSSFTIPRIKGDAVEILQRLAVSIESSLAKVKKDVERIQAAISAQNVSAPKAPAAG